MPARKLYEDYYESGSTAKKYNNYTKISPNKNVKTGKNKSLRREKIQKKNNVSVIVFILSVFAMTMLLTYRYNLISEKNLETIKLQSDLSKVESSLLTSQIEVEQSTDLNKIEAYAKQQLGMQKPDKNQTIYVDTSSNTNVVEVENNNNNVQNIIDNIKDMINKIF